MRKILLVLCAAGLLAGCSGKNTSDSDISGETPSAANETLPVSEMPVSEFVGWRASYRSALENFMQTEDYSRGCAFSVFDADKNGTPELYISEGEYHAASVRIYTFGGELEELGEFGSNGEVRFHTEMKILANEHSGQGAYNCTYYSLENNALTKLDSFYDNAGTGWDDIFYKLNDIEVSEEEYSQAQEKYKSNSGYIKLGRDFPLTDAFIDAALSEQDYWFDIYSDLLYAISESDSDRADEFSLYDVNGDEIPELFISEGTLRESGCRIYSFNGGLVSLGKYGTYGYVSYLPNLGLIKQSNEHWGYYYAYFYSFREDFSLFCEKSLFNDKGTADLPDGVEYLVDGSPADEAEFQAELEKYRDGDFIPLGHDYTFTQQDISAILSEYK